MTVQLLNTSCDMVESNATQHREEPYEDPADFERFGLDARIITGLQKKDILKPTAIQAAAISVIVEGNDAIVRAKNGSGKTFAYLIPLLEKLVYESPFREKMDTTAVILAPTRDLCREVHSEVSSFIELCEFQLRTLLLTGSMSVSEMNTAVSGPVDIIVSTPACMLKCVAAGAGQPEPICDYFSIIVLDKADLLLSYGYEEDLKALKYYLPRNCQCVIVLATSSDDNEMFIKLCLHVPWFITLPEAKSGDSKDEIIPKDIQQFSISCSQQDKLLHVLAILKLELVQKKVLIFAKTIDMSYRLKLFLEKFGIMSSVLNPELPQKSRTRVVEEFNAGLFDFLIAAADGHAEAKGPKNPPKNFKKDTKHKLVSKSSKIVKGLNLKRVYTVINYEMPPTTAVYMDRISLAERSQNAGTFISLVCPEEITILNEIRSFSGVKEGEESTFITPFPLLTRSAIESLRYRAEDIAKSVTKIAIREARACDLRTELLNSEKLKAHFEENPRDLDILKHDKAFFKKPPLRHLRNVPDYLLDSTTQDVIKAFKISRDAMGNSVNTHNRAFKPKRKGTRAKSSPRANADSVGEQKHNIHKKRKRNHA